jgi:hypothetical protein
MAHKTVFTRGRIEVKTTADLAKRLTQQAMRRGLCLSAFIRMVLSEYLERTEAEARRPRGGGK